MGDNVYLGDRNGVRTPMQWSADRNAGFSRANPQQLIPAGRSSTPSTTTRRSTSRTSSTNPHSLLWWTQAPHRAAQALSRRSAAAAVEFLHPGEPAHPRLRPPLRGRERAGRRQPVALRAVRGARPVARSRACGPSSCSAEPTFPLVGERPTCSPWARTASTGSRWSASRPTSPPAPSTPRRRLTRRGAGWDELLHGESRQVLERALPAFLQRQRWFAGKARNLRGTTLSDIVPLRGDGQTLYLTFVTLQYVEGSAETQTLVLGYAGGETRRSACTTRPKAWSCAYDCPPERTACSTTPRWRKASRWPCCRRCSGGGACALPAASCPACAPTPSPRSTSMVCVPGAAARAVQQQHRYRRQGAAQAVPAAGARPQPRLRDRPVTSRSAASSTPRASWGPGAPAAPWGGARHGGSALRVRRQRRRCLAPVPGVPGRVPRPRPGRARGAGCAR